MSDIQKIKDKLDIVSVIGTYIKLEKAGNNFKARCPFHNEKSPSFFVSPDRNAFYCFGCHSKGDIFTFVSMFEGLDFVGSLKVLASRAGVELDFKDKEKNPNDVLFKIMETASFFFQKKLQEKKEAKDYLSLRGVLDKTILDWQIGYSENDWRSLLEFLISKGFSKEDIFSCGLIKRKEGTDTYYDTFRGRIMFPIFDSSGRVIAFSGRILIKDDKSPKYLNSPETSLFSKSDVLYGLDKAKYKIKDENSAILVEGQMDLIMLHQCGLENTVASSGTALTENHLKKIKRFASKIILAFDGDSAGLSATIRSANIAIPLELEVYVCSFDDGVDPADMAIKDKELLREKILKSENIISFLLSKIINEEKDELSIMKRVVRDIMPILSLVPSFLQKSYFIKYMSDKLKVKEEVLFDELKRVAVNLPQRDQTTKISKSPQKTNFLRTLFGILFWQQNVKDKKIDPDSLQKDIKELLPDTFEENLKKYKDEGEPLLFEIESYYNNTNKLKELILEIISNLKLESLQKEFTESLYQLKEFEKSKDNKNMEIYLNKCKELSDKINSIKKTYEKK